MVLQISPATGIRVIMPSNTIILRLRGIDHQPATLDKEGLDLVWLPRGDGRSFAFRKAVDRRPGARKVARVFPARQCGLLAARPASRHCEPSTNDARS